LICNVCIQKSVFIQRLSLCIHAPEAAVAAAATTRVLERTNIQEDSFSITSKRVLVVVLNAPRLVVMFACRHEGGLLAGCLAVLLP
jgi:hypothetical protein